MIIVIISILSKYGSLSTKLPKLDAFNLILRDSVG